MTVHLPTIKQLQYLVALRQHGHFGKAAEACFVTQSTLSAGLRELETLLNVTLVERTRRLVRFTALGEKIADKAVRVLRETEELAEMARAEGQPLHGELRMGVIPSIARPCFRAFAANGRASSCTCARRRARRPARHFTAASSTACCLPSPMLAGR